MFFKEIKKYKENISKHFKTIDELNEILNSLKVLNNNMTSLNEDLSNEKPLNDLSFKIGRYIEFLNMDILSYDTIIRKSRIARIMYGILFFVICAINFSTNTSLLSFFVEIGILTIFGAIIATKIEMDYDTSFCSNCKEIAEKYDNAPVNVAGLYNPVQDITDIKEELSKTTYNLSNDLKEFFENIKKEREDDYDTE